MRHRTTRYLWMFVLLAAALGVTVLLALDTEKATRSHRETAEGVLNDFAAFGAGEFRGRLERELNYYCLFPLLNYLQSASPGSGGPPPDVRAPSGVSPDVSRALPRVATFFWLEPQTEELVTSTDAAPFSESERGYVLRTGREQLGTDRQFGLYLPDGPSPRPVVMATLRVVEGTPTKLAGFLLRAGALEAMVGEAYGRSPIIAPALFGGANVDSLITASVLDGERLVFQSRPEPAEPGKPSIYGAYAPRFVASDTLAAELGRMVVRVELHPDAAGFVVLGGLPRSRIPVTIVLLVVVGLLLFSALRIMRRESELAQLRGDFASGISHEFRTPLAQIRLFSETLLLGRVRSQDEGKRALAIIDQEARRLTHLVETVLHFSRAERGVLRIDRRDCNVGDVLREVAESFQPLARASEARLHVDLAPDVEAHVDPDALKQLVLNLLDNALKYGPAGQTVRLEMKPAPQHADRLRIAVTDEGPGVPRGQREVVWSRFSRLARDRNSAVAGTGIGLSVVREIATKHEGRVWIEDAIPRGGRFLVEIPMRTRKQAS